MTVAEAVKVGKVVQVIGPVVDIEFAGGHLPALFSERSDYRDFHLRAELKLGDQSNSGIYFRSSFGADRNGKFPFAYEAQLMNQDPSGPLSGSLRLHGSMQPDPSFLRSTIAPDEWFVVEVIAKDDHLTVRINNRMTCDVVDSERLYRSGHLVLQAMDRSIVHFRKIEIKDLSAAAAAESRRPMNRAVSSGGAVNPPLKLNPASAGTSKSTCVPDRK